MSVGRYALAVATVKRNFQMCPLPFFYFLYFDRLDFAKQANISQKPTTSVSGALLAMCVMLELLQLQRTMFNALLDSCAMLELLLPPRTLSNALLDSCAMLEPLQQQKFNALLDSYAMLERLLPPRTLSSVLLVIFAMLEPLLLLRTTGFALLGLTLKKRDFPPFLNATCAHLTRTMQTEPRNPSMTAFRALVTLVGRQCVKNNRTP